MRHDRGWALDPAITFLNHGSFGACPPAVLEVQRAWRDRLEAEPVRFLDRELDGALDHVRTVLGAFLGADPEGLAFVPNATTGVNAVLRSLRFEPGDELLTDDHEYNATLTTMQAVAARDDARVVIAPLPFPTSGADELAEAFLAGVTARTRLAVVSHLTSPSALILPVERLVSELAARGIDTLVDGAHAPGQVPLSLDALGAAYYTGNGHKWLCGPKGTGFLWVRADRRAVIHPTVTSHGANDPRTDRPRFQLEFDWVGTADPTGILALPAAIEWMATQEPGGWPAVMAANHALAIDGRDRLAAALGVAPPAPDDRLGAMAALAAARARDERGGRCAARCAARRGRDPGPHHGLPGPWRATIAGRRSAPAAGPPLGPAVQRARRLRPAGLRARAPAHRGVDRAEEPARDATDQRRRLEAGLDGETLPRRAAERVRDPRIAAVRVVLDDHERGPGPEMRGQPADRLDLAVAGHEMEAVGGDEAVERRQRERLAHVGAERGDRHRREARRDRLFAGVEDAAIAVDRHDLAARTQQVGDGQGERSAAGADVRPDGARSPAPGLDRRSHQSDVIRVVHRVSPCSGARPRHR